MRGVVGVVTVAGCAWQRGQDGHHSAHEGRGPGGEGRRCRAALVPRAPRGAMRERAAPGGGGGGGGPKPLKLLRFRASEHKSVDACLHPVLPWVALCDQGNGAVLWDYEQKETLYELSPEGVSNEWFVAAAVQASAEAQPSYTGQRDHAAMRPRTGGKLGAVRCVRLYDDDVAAWREWETARAARSAPRDASALGGSARSGAVRGTQWLAVVWEQGATFVELSSGKARQVFRSELEGKPQMSRLEIMGVHSHTIAAIGCNDGSIRVLALGSFKPVARLAGGHRGAVLSMLVLPNSRLLTGGADGSIALWDLSMARPSGDTDPKMVVPAHKDGVSSLAIYPGPMMPRVVTAGGDKTVALWDLATLRELARQQPNDKLQCIRAEPWFHPRFPRVDCVFATRNSQIGVVALESKGQPPNMLLDLDQVIRPPGDKPHVKVYTLAVHPLRPSVVSIGTNAGLVIIEVDPSFAPAAAALPVAPGGDVSHRAVYARGRNLLSLGFSVAAGGGEDGLPGVEQTEERVAVLRSDAACSLHAHPSEELLAVFWPGAQSYAVYRTSDWRILDEGRASSLGWDAVHPRLVLLSAPPPQQQPPQMRGRGKKAKEEYAMAMKAYIAVQEASSTEARVQIKGLEGDKMEMYNDALEVESVEKRLGVFGGGFFGVRGTEPPQRADEDSLEGYRSSKAASARQRERVQLFRWDTHTAIGPAMPCPSKIVWDVECEFVAFVYPHSVSLFQAQPSFHLLGSVSIEGVADAQWFRSQLFMLTPTTIECCFISGGGAGGSGDGGGMRARAKRPSMEFVTLATLSPWAGASMACQQTNATPSPLEVAAAARLPPPARRPAGALALLTIRDGAVWLCDALGVVHSVPLKHPGVLCRCLAAYGDAGAAVACSASLDAAHADDLATHLAVAGEPRAALALRGVSPRARAIIASGRGAGMRPLPPSEALAIVEQAAVDIDPLSGRGTGFVTDPLEALTLGTAAKVGRAAAAGIAAVAHDYLHVAAHAQRQGLRDVAAKALSALAAAAPMLEEDALHATLARLAQGGQWAKLEATAEALLRAADLGSAAADARSTSLASNATMAALLLGRNAGGDALLFTALKRSGAHAEAVIAARARGLEDDGGALEAANAALEKHGVRIADA